MNNLADKTPHDQDKFANVWVHLRKGDSRPAIELFRMLERNGCAGAARGFVDDLTERIIEAPQRFESLADANRFVAAGKSALQECLHDDPNAVVNYLRAALHLKMPRFRDLLRFRLIHVFLLTAVCAAAVSFIGNLTAIAVIYCSVLFFVVPLYAISLHNGYCGVYRSAKNALLISVTILLVFLFAMTRAEIRNFYPLVFWCIPAALVLAAAYVLQVERSRLLSPNRDSGVLLSE